MSMATEQTEHDVILRLEFAEGCVRSALEERAIAVLEVLEQHASHIALGPVVSGHFDPPVIELDFNVLATSQTELFRRIAEIIEVVEQCTPLRRVVGASMSERELVPA